MTRLLLEHKFALGDAVLFTALCRDIHKAYPGQFDILVDTCFRELFQYNPHVTLKPEKPGEVKKLKISYSEGIRANANKKIHMLSWFHRDFSTQMGMPLPVTLPHGDIHMTADELQPKVPGRYWLVLAGGKRDATVKIWRQERWQHVVNAMNLLGHVCVQTGATHPDHIHYKLNGIVDMVGRCKGARELVALIANAEGVICGITGAMHIAACFDKPCVVIAGGREEPWWEGYTNVYKAFGPTCAPVRVEHRFLHTIGLLECCQSKGCWKHRTVPLGLRDQWENQQRRCRLPVQNETGVAAPKCNGHDHD